MKPIDRLANIAGNFRRAAAACEEQIPDAELGLLLSDDGGPSGAGHYSIASLFDGAARALDAVIAELEAEGR